MIERLFRRLRPFIKYVVRYPVRMLVASFALALVGFLLAVNLRIDNDLSKLIPDNYPSVQALNTLRDQVGAENEAAVAIESPSFEANKAFAEDFIGEALALQNPETGEPRFTGAEFKKDITFLENNALYFATTRELDQLESYLNDRLEQADLELNPFYIELEDDTTDSVGEELSAMYDELIGSEYLVSEDSLTLVVKLFPAGSQTDIGFIRSTYRDLQQLVDQMNPSSYQPDMKITLAGRLLRTLVEVETITADVKDSFGAGVLMLLVVVVIYFFYKSYTITAGRTLNYSVLIQEFIRIPSIVLIMGLPLVLSLCWTFGLTYLLYGNLNIMTSTLGLLLFGMGIDFGIHFFARYSEEREAGIAVDEAVETTFMTTGQAITVVGITTSAAFFILTLADFKGFSEFGFIAGVGILFAILAYIVFLPALIVLLERGNWLNLKLALAKVDTQSSRKEKQVSSIFGNRIFLYTVLAFGLALTAYSAFNVFNLRFEYNFGSLEPDYVRYDELNRRIRRAYSDRQTRNPAYIITDTREQAIEVANILRSRAQTDTLTPTIDRVEIFQDRFPLADSAVNAKLSYIGQIRDLIGDPLLQDEDDEQLQRLQKAASTTGQISIEQVPGFIKNPFISKTGELGTLVIIYPSVGLSDGRNSINFANDVGEVQLASGKTFYAGSSSIVAADMLRLMINEAPKMVILTIIVIIIFKLLILGRIRWVTLALLPLLASFLWMFGLMATLGWKLNFYNLVVLPTVLGIGDDSGIHIIHRYLEEGKGSVNKVLLSTGEHITVSALTTIVGFGGLLFSIHPGMASIGELAILGITLTLVAALIILPAILKLMELHDKQQPALSTQFGKDKIVS